MRDVKQRFPGLITVISLVVFCVLFSGLTLRAGDAKPYVKVLLKNGSIEKFDYESFTFNWIYPITIKDQEMCESHEITKDDIDEVYIINEFYNNCDNKDDWEVDVYLVNKRQILGFFNVNDFSVRGKLLETGEEKRIPLKDVKKVSFKR